LLSFLPENIGQSLFDFWLKLLSLSIFLLWISTFLNKQWKNFIILLQTKLKNSYHVNLDWNFIQQKPIINSNFSLNFQ
jgi:hypothetical protein